jgi:intracellular septation protein A
MGEATRHDYRYYRGQLFHHRGLRGGHYVGRGLARYMPYSDIDPGRMAFSMGLVGLVMAALNYVVAKIASTDVWLFYKTFVDFFIVAGLAMVAVRFARKPA